MELYDVPSVALSNSSQEKFVALLDGYPDGSEALYDDAGTDILVLNRPETQGKKFKLRVMGEFKKGLTLGKAKPEGYDTSEVEETVQAIFPGKTVSNIASDPYCGLTEAYVSRNGVFVNCFEFTIGSSSTEILLGESKYFYAIQDPDDSTNLLIKELEVDPQSEDPLTLPSDGLADGFSGDDLIEVISGGKSGVYWERKRAIIDNNGSITVQDLPDGIVRVIGRYWENGKAYNVRLKASSGNRVGELEIKVVKPDKLGDMYAKARDVFDQVINVDSLIIANAGKYGIPPQLLKAHISGEVYTEDFGAGVGEGFTPGYLYEPFTVEWWLRDIQDDYVLKKEWEDNDFSVSSGSMGSGVAVPVHLYTEKQTYPSNPVTIWKMVNKYSSISGSSPSGEWNSYYKKKDTSSRLQFYYSQPREVYEDIIGAVREKNKDLEVEEVYSQANDSLVAYLKSDWRGGLDNLYAQTRIASSYGYFQVLYTTGILSIKSGGANYPRTELPEKLNEVETNFRVAMVKYNELLNEIADSNWEKGYEQVWFELVSNWNSKREYSSSIYKNIKNFLPQNP